VFAIAAIEGTLGLFGPLTPSVRVAHAFLGLVFFALTVAIAVVTSRTWKLAGELPSGARSVKVLASLALLATWAQAALGVLFRHGVLGQLMPHALGAVSVAITVLVWAMTIMYGLDHRLLRATAVTMLIVTAVQMVAGLFLFSVSAILEIDPAVVIVTAMVHAATAALTLASTLSLALLTWRILVRSDIGSRS
jgi:hypothetical protein